MRLAVVIALLAVSLQGADLPLIAWQGGTMGSAYTVQIADARLAEKEIEALQTAIDQRLQAVNRQMSHFQPDSELSRFNRAPAKTPFPVSPEFAQVTRQALELNRRSGGAFDPTLGPVINLWGFGEQGGAQHTPAAGLLQEALRETGCQHLAVTEKGQLVKDLANLQLNLSAIAKGFGVDEMARVLRARGLTNFYASISGEVFASGHNAKGQPWHVGIAAPFLKWTPGGPLAAIVPVSGQAISTSGDYQKYFVDEAGRRWCHILNPKSGRPVQHNLASVSVVAADCVTADALATALFVLGPQEGLRWMEAQSGAAALFIVREADGRFRKFASAKFPQWTDCAP
jgi:thiamine biosynthesis lipoprotein